MNTLFFLSQATSQCLLLLLIYTVYLCGSRVVQKTHNTETYTGVLQSRWGVCDKWIGDLFTLSDIFLELSLDKTLLEEGFMIVQD